MSSKDEVVSGALALLDLLCCCETLVDDDGDTDANEAKGTALGVLYREFAGQGGSRRVLSSNFLKITISGSWATSTLGVGDLRRLAVPSLRCKPLDTFVVGLSSSTPSLGSSRPAKLEGLTTIW